MKQSEKTAVPPPSVPPPYSLTQGIYPVIDVQNGEIHIRGDTESGQLRAHYNPFVPEPSNVYTPQVGGAACYEPFSDRIERDAEAPKDGACGSDSQPRQKTRPEAPSSESDGRSGDRQTAGTPVMVVISLKGNWIPEPEVKKEEESFEQCSVASGSDWLSERAEVGPETEAREMLRLLRGVTQLESKVHDLYEKASQQITEKTV
ncbi:hypothetical protein ILYODFUR_038718 [Ilyodon furcidens]|uniref:Uncharacterized protein n=1 Tax=Ilyodon furcidens TaxID=33524 RepID=A0ABV0U2E0_9TELE